MNKMRSELSDVQAGRRFYNLIGLLVLLCLLVIAPFILFGETFESWLTGLLHAENVNDLLLAGLVVTGLSIDIFLPVPSSLVSVWSGYHFGWLVGALLSTLGMSLGCLLGYVAGHIGKRLISEDSQRYYQQLTDKYGLWLIPLFRGIPVLAEASVLFLGISRFPFMQFFWISCASNLGLSIVYAGAGHYSFLHDNFLLAVLFAFCLPVCFYTLFMIIKKILLRREV